MARLNTRPSVVSSIPSSRQVSQTPGPRDDSDQENRDPASHERQKGKQRAMPPPAPRHSIATPLSNSSDDSRGHKRKRNAMPVEQRARDADPEEEKFTKYFDPNQDPEQRRQVKRQTRELDREFRESRDDLLREHGNGLQNLVQRANATFKNVKQTGDATIDSRLLVDISDLGYKKSAQLVLRDTSTGVDVDEFLSKCITYMRNGGPLEQGDAGPSTQSARRRRGNEESDAEDIDDEDSTALDWELFGRTACFPYNARPPCPSFLLGPLSVEKKARAMTQRRARQRRDDGNREARPENIEKEDLEQNEQNQLTAICSRIKKHLERHCAKAEQTFTNAGITSEEELKQTARGRALLKKARVTDNGLPSLFEYVINPDSFGQTVENIFYISFLIKEGAVGIFPDSNGLPALTPTVPRTAEQRRTDRAQRHQAIFALDFATWRQLIEAFDIRESMIPHRTDDEPVQVGERGWYG